MRDEAGFSSNLWIAYRLTTVLWLKFFFTDDEWMNQRGLVLTFLGWVHKAIIQKKGGCSVFPYKHTFLWNVPVTWQIVYHPYRAVFLRLKSKMLWFGMLLWCLMRILKLDIGWPLRFNYIFHYAPCIAPSFREHAKEVSLVFHGKDFVSYREMITWKNKAHGKIFQIAFALSLFLRCPAFWWKIQGFRETNLKS